MKRLIIGGLAALAIGLVAAPVAGAGPDAQPKLTPTTVRSSRRRTR